MGDRTVYYIDSRSGDDSHSGTSPEQAWKSLRRVNEAVFGPGDHIRFAAGSRYVGQIKPQGSGREGEPILMDSYGEGDLPRIDAAGEYSEALHLYNVEYWEIRNLEFTNTGTERQAKRKGVFIQIHNFGTAHHIRLQHLYIHDVNASNVKSDGRSGGIVWENSGNEIESRFDGLSIEHCRLERCDRCGIVGGGYWRRTEWHPSLNVVIRGNRLEDIGGDGIVPTGTDGCLVEYNTIRGGRMRDQGACAGIWPWSSDNTVIQYNEVSHYKGTFDGQGFDSDWNCRNTLIQYNYSHDNEGGFVLICNDGHAELPVSAGNEGTVIRYNVSVNDQCRTIHIAGPTRGPSIHHNLIYIGRTCDLPLLLVTNWNGVTEEARFEHNIFYSDGTARYGMGKKISDGVHQLTSGLGSLRYAFHSNRYIGHHVEAPADSAGGEEAPSLINELRPLFLGDGSVECAFELMKAMWGTDQNWREP